MGRYTCLVATSNSGKQLFSCRYCGRVTPTPDKNCPEPPKVVNYLQSKVKSCAQYEKDDNDMAVMKASLEVALANSTANPMYEDQLLREVTDFLELLKKRRV